MKLQYPSALPLLLLAYTCTSNAQPTFRRPSLQAWSPDCSVTASLIATTQHDSLLIVEQPLNRRQYIFSDRYPSQLLIMPTGEVVYVGSQSKFTMAISLVIGVIDRFGIVHEHELSPQRPMSYHIQTPTPRLDSLRATADGTVQIVINHVTDKPLHFAHYGVYNIHISALLDHEHPKPQFEYVYLEPPASAGPWPFLIGGANVAADLNAYWWIGDPHNPAHLGTGQICLTLYCGNLLSPILTKSSETRINTIAASETLQATLASSVELSDTSLILRRIEPDSIFTQIPLTQIIEHAAKLPLCEGFTLPDPPMSKDDLPAPSAVRHFPSGDM